MIIAPYRLGLTATYERPDGKHELLEDLLGPVVYRKDVDELAGEYLSEYETIHMSVDLTADEREEYDEEYQIYRDYVDSHEFDLWKRTATQSSSNARPTTRKGGGRSSPSNVPSESPEPPKRNSTRSTTY